MWNGSIVSRKSKFIVYAKFWFQKIHSKAKKTVASLLKNLQMVYTLTKTNMTLLSSSASLFYAQNIVLLPYCLYVRLISSINMSLLYL